MTATPIGNWEDITLRALRVLKEADYILAEDTRKTGQFLKRFAIEKPLVSFFEHNENFKTTKIIEELEQGKNIVLVSDAGTPTISDPGYRLLRECKQKNLAVTSLPGPSSVINALVLSAAPRDKFMFMGYLPKKTGERGRILCKIKESNLTAVIFESPHRFLNALRQMRQILGDRMITVAREMTKKFEEAKEMTVEQALEYFEKNEPRGELTIVIYRQDQ